MRLRLFLALILLTFFVNPVFAAKPTPPPPIPYSVCVDAGHGGNDIGTENQELTEKEINLQVAQLLKEKLETVGYTVFMTRTDDSTLSNADRYNFCNAQTAAILISIHHNGSSSSAVDYSQALYMKKSDVALAQEVVNTVSTSLGIPSQGISRFASGVLLKAKMPATISEGFFLTNSTEYSLIKNNNRLEQEAEALSAAVQNYFDN
ncbi:MAG: hypothetical protein US96_C0011G0019 [Candidatus Woesebacteria bacterium GW2011_GWB1_38_5b]|uniref:MurNAc-LAA domain-containing protein n=1 Tax=Candidatus Woesebacteria bacterium GW2011_GWB1_38_5b TaxID=1618569 RepID=A0A0G0NE79_9BACT|nr:MAG: hypothetical protein US96_C0011G0019 [Candidatus Woesebacteria bacterium GW2011_GWB1_38_5b]OGH47348.1 MAG: hypothetical protein A3A51_01080 [Candidatus Levybacteria bacterium RIFCSPLOWO2_01_FULL_39_10]